MYASEQTVLAGDDPFMTVRHLTIRGTNFEIGRRLGEAAIEHHGTSAARLAAAPPYSRARRLYFQRHYPIHWERTRGAAAAFGVDPEDDGYDVTGIMYNVDAPAPPPGCSVVYYPPATTASGGGYLSRNYDFTTGSIAELFGGPLPPEARARTRPAMREPYVMEWYPEDGGYASLAIQAFDVLSGTLDGINSAGLVVSIMADNEALNELGPGLEPHFGPVRAIGLHELQVMRWLLDTCATADEAKDALLTVKQYYALTPCHYIVADRAGRSFVYENSTRRNVQHVIDGTGAPQIVTNYQLYRHPDAEPVLNQPLTMQNEAFWRYQTLADRIAQHSGRFTPEDLKANNDCVNVQRLIAGGGPALAALDASMRVRTLWHSLYDQERGTVDFSFYLGEGAAAGGAPGERRSDYVRFTLDPSRVPVAG